MQQNDVAAVSEEDREVLSGSGNKIGRLLAELDKADVLSAGDGGRTQMK